MYILLCSQEFSYYVYIILFCNTTVTIAMHMYMYASKTTNIFYMYVIKISTENQQNVLRTCQIDRLQIGCLGVFRLSSSTWVYGGMAAHI